MKTYQKATANVFRKYKNKLYNHINGTSITFFGLVKYYLKLARKCDKYKKQLLKNTDYLIKDIASYKEKIISGCMDSMCKSNIYHINELYKLSVEYETSRSNLEKHMVMLLGRDAWIHLSQELYT